MAIFGLQPKFSVLRWNLWPLWGREWRNFVDLQFAAQTTNSEDFAGIPSSSLIIKKDDHYHWSWSVITGIPGMFTFCALLPGRGSLFPPSRPGRAEKHICSCTSHFTGVIFNPIFDRPEQDHFWPFFHFFGHFWPKTGLRRARSDKSKVYFDQIFEIYASHFEIKIP